MSTSLALSSGLGLIGCQDNTDHKTSKNTVEDRVQFGQYSLSADTYDHFMAETAESEEAIKYEELVGFCKVYDSNKDNYLSKKEVDEGFKDLAASVKGL